MANAFPQGTVHEAGEDFQAALRRDPTVFALWNGLTPLGRNEFICWVDDAKQPMTRQRRIERTCAELLEGKKRPCCWAGCIHRTDKAPSRWQQAVLIDQNGKNAHKPLIERSRLATFTQRQRFKAASSNAPWTAEPDRLQHEYSICSSAAGLPPGVRSNRVHSGSTVPMWTCAMEGRRYTWEACTTQFLAGLASLQPNQRLEAA